MYLNKLINLLYTIPEGTVFEEGFHNAHSYRGSYENLGVEPKSNTTIEQMLSCLEQAVGETYRGYKGGEFTMIGTEDVYLAYKDCTGNKIIGYKVTEFGYELLVEQNSY